MVLVALALTVVFWVIPKIDYLWLNAAELSLLKSHGWNSILPNTPIIYWSILGLWIVISIGLLKRVKYFRAIYVASLIATCIANVLWGYVVLSPLEAGIVNLLGMFDGAILALAFFTSVSNSFKITLTTPFTQMGTVMAFEAFIELCV